MDVYAIKSMTNSAALPEPKAKAAAVSPNSVSGNRSPDPETITILPGTSEAGDGDGEERLKKAVEDANKRMEFSNSHLNFSIDEATKKVVVKVIDGSTNEVIRQIPAEEMLELSAKFQEINALLFSQKV